MLCQHVCGRCVGGAWKVMVAFYAESACAQKVMQKVMVAFYAESACVWKVRGRCVGGAWKVHGKCAEGDGGILC